MFASNKRGVTAVGAIMISAMALAACSSSTTPTATAGATTTTPAAVTTTSAGGATTDATTTAAPTATLPTDPVTIKLNSFGDFGYKDLYAKYKELHPNVTVVETDTSYGDHHNRIAKDLATGTGLGDIEAIEEGYTAKFKAMSDKWVDIAKAGFANRQADYLDWKWTQATAADGSVIGFGTDVGPLAMCYRSDMLIAGGTISKDDKAARDTLSAKWKTWDDYLASGAAYVAKTGGKAWVDSATNLYNVILGQSPNGEAYWKNNTSDLIFDSSAGVKTAWDVTMKAIAQKQTAKLAAFSPEWNAGFTNGTFATLPCPAWMRGYIKSIAGTTFGKWDITTLPGGGGNWGGSFLAVPKSSKNQAIALDLANFLTSPASELTIFKNTGNFPSIKTLYTDDALVSFKDEFFNSAPAGKIYGSSAASLKPVWQAPRTGDVRTAVEADITAIEKGQLTPDAGWTKAKADAIKASGD